MAEFGQAGDIAAETMTRSSSERDAPAQQGGHSEAARRALGRTPSP